MVRFVLRNRAMSVSVKMDMKEEDEVSEIGDTAAEYWGEGFILRSGYSLLRPDGKVGDLIGDGDIVDALPDPDFFTRRRPGPPPAHGLFILRSGWIAARDAG